MFLEHGRELGEDHNLAHGGIGRERHALFRLVGAEFERTLVAARNSSARPKPAKKLGARCVRVEITVDPVDGNVA